MRVSIVVHASGVIIDGQAGTNEAVEKSWIERSGAVTIVPVEHIKIDSGIAGFTA